MPEARTLRFSHFYLCQAKTVRAASLTMSSLQAVFHNDKCYDSWACSMTHQVCSDSILLSSSAPSAARLRRLRKQFHVLLLHPATITDGKVRRSNSTKDPKAPGQPSAQLLLMVWPSTNLKEICCSSVLSALIRSSPDEPKAKVCQVGMSQYSGTNAPIRFVIVWIDPSTLGVTVLPV